MKGPTYMPTWTRRDHELHTHSVTVTEASLWVGGRLRLFLSSWKCGDRDGKALKELSPSSLPLEDSSGKVSLQEGSKILGTTKE